MSRIHSHDLESCYGVFPDLAMLGEYIGGGCSLSVVGGRKDVMAKCVSQSLITQEGIYDNGDSALAVAIGLAANRVLTEEKINEANRLEEKLRECVELTVRDDTTPMVQATGLGSMVGLHFKGTRPPSGSDPYTSTYCTKVYTWGTETSFVHLSHTKGKHVDQFSEAIRAFLSEVLKGKDWLTHMTGTSA